MDSFAAFVRNFACWIIDRFVGDKLFANALRSSRSIGVGEYWKLINEKDEYNRQFQKMVVETFNRLCKPLLMHW